MIRPLYPRDAFELERSRVGMDLTSKGISLPNAAIRILIAQPITNSVTEVSSLDS